VKLSVGYRKYTLCVMAMTYAFILGLLSKLTAEFSTVVSITVASFAAANAFNKRANSPNNSTPE
jgi:hypothetical protein